MRNISPTARRESPMLKATLETMRNRTRSKDIIWTLAKGVPEVYRPIGRLVQSAISGFWGKLQPARISEACSRVEQACERADHACNSCYTEHSLQCRGVEQSGSSLGS